MTQRKASFTDPEWQALQRLSGVTSTESNTLRAALACLIAAVFGEECDLLEFRVLFSKTEQRDLLEMFAAVHRGGARPNSGPKKNDKS